MISASVIRTLAKIKWYDAALLAVEVVALVPKKERSRFFRWLAHAGPDPSEVVEEAEEEAPPKKKKKKNRKGKK